MNTHTHTHTHKTTTTTPLCRFALLSITHITRQFLKDTGSPSTAESPNSIFRSNPNNSSSKVFVVLCHNVDRNDSLWCRHDGATHITRGRTEKVKSQPIRLPPSLQGWNGSKQTRHSTPDKLCSGKVYESLWDTHEKVGTGPMCQSSKICWSQQ